MNTDSEKMYIWNIFRRRADRTYWWVENRVCKRRIMTIHLILSSLFSPQKYCFIINIEKQLFILSSPLLSSSPTGSMAFFLNFVYGHHSIQNSKLKKKQIKNTFHTIMAKKSTCVHQRVFSLKSCFACPLLPWMNNEAWEQNSCTLSMFYLLQHF